MAMDAVWDRHMAYTEWAWWWHHTPTFHHFGVEGVFQTTLLLSSEGADSNVRAAGVVLTSLTPNARSCFALLAASQMQNKEEAGMWEGIAFRVVRDGKGEKGGYSYALESRS